MSDELDIDLSDIFSFNAEDLLSDFDLGSESMPSHAGTIQRFEEMLLKREPNSEKQYGIFDKDISVCRFFEDKNNEEILSDIMQKNTETGMGNIEIPNTNIKLVNYSYCPNCNKIFTQKMLYDYYRKPVIRPGTSLRHALRNEIRVVCDDCNTLFLPTLIIVDGTPKNSVQYLCRNQVINAIEVYMLKTHNKNVLTRNKKNVRVNRKDKLIACANDVNIKELENRPTLITNFIQYTPPPYILNFMEGKNIENDDLVFDAWQKPKTKEERIIMDIVSR